MTDTKIDTTTRRGVRPLLALLLTGMALLMMGAARPVMAATVQYTTLSVTPGGPTQDDTIYYYALATWSSVGCRDPYSVTLFVDYYAGSTIIGHAPDKVPVDHPASGTSADSISGTSMYSGYTWAHDHMPTGCTGFKWYYVFLVQVFDSNNQQAAMGIAISEDKQWGAFSDDHGGDGPHE